MTTPEQRKSAMNCPRCGQAMTHRREPDGPEVLGCSAWPECEYSEDLPEDLILRRSNHSQLPGFQDAGGGSFSSPAG